MNKRRIKTPLSPNEELTLRRIAIAIGPIEDIAVDVIARLRRFGLIDDRNRLTLAGRDRYDSLERPHRGESAGHGESFSDTLLRIARASY